MPRGIVRRLLPFWLRLELARLRRLPAFLREHDGLTLPKASPFERLCFEHWLARHRSPLCRGSGADPRLQAGKEANVETAAYLIDGTLLAPGQVFSYLHTVGRPTRRRGFRRGLELHDDRMTAGLGGGCCMVSNMVYYLALCSGMEIVERHRHALDLFPDDSRTIPFGCGATVYYNFADLRFRNALDMPVLISLRLDEGHLVGELRSKAQPGGSVEVYEVDHRFFRSNAGWMRENRLRRRSVSQEGTVLKDEEVAHNLARVLYLPEDI
jgi:vancomycin resistance protein VanW